jgi:hypothetical protein
MSVFIKNSNGEGLKTKYLARYGGSTYLVLLTANVIRILELPALIKIVKKEGLKVDCTANQAIFVFSDDESSVFLL